MALTTTLSRFFVRGKTPLCAASLVLASGLAPVQSQYSILTSAETDEAAALQISTVIGQEHTLRSNGPVVGVDGVGISRPSVPLRSLRAVEPPRTQVATLSPWRDLVALDLRATEQANDAQREALPTPTAQIQAINVSALDALDLPEESEPLRCMTETLYFEARGEPLEGQIAVAEVVLNRVDSPRYPDTICGVVAQGAHRLHACQFSFMCDHASEEMEDEAVRDRLAKLAAIMIEGRDRFLTDGATHYHATRVSPDWAGRLEQTAEIGLHIFYRPPLRQAAAGG
ncbi:MAG: cell wall hydrolase [Pseudomonadota bacterium]